MALSTHGSDAPMQASPFYTKLAKIHKLTDVSGTNPYSSDYDPWDLGVQVDIEFRTKQDEPYTKSIYIGGNVIWDNNDPTQMKYWGKATWLRTFFQSFNIEFGSGVIPEITGREIPNQALHALAGKDVVTLHYVNGVNPSRENAYWYNLWNTILWIPNVHNDDHVRDKRNELAKRFEESVARGWPKNYKPHLIQRQEVEPMDENYGKPTDDDIPF